MVKENIIGKSFEELDEQNMINIQGGAATPTTTLTSATTTSSIPCGLASAGISVVSLLSVSLIYTVAGGK